VSDADDLKRFAERLLILAEPESGAEMVADESDALLALARALYDSRRLRERHLGGAPLGEPAWDILLDLFVASRTGTLRAVKEVCLASGAPEATALRYIEALIGGGLALRVRDTVDQRRRFIALTAEGHRRMTIYLGEAARVLRAANSATLMLVGSTS